ncbi:TetR/AcrR family transcriptional regulator [Brevibacterium oceani]|uniref:TetR/AcrR family transcriptional regulator n=1 Tax=Brevibacterium oceani TaxID=358099 RepID=UPI001B3449C9|nr:TetR/AcrR family transcriptional regulator [Brevibacterium oceani]
MTGSPTPDTRTRLLNAAADLIAESPGEDFSLRAVCDVVGVKMPTLYHFFGSKQGLIDAVITRGFDMYLGEKSAMESSGDPIQDLRSGWDAHVEFGLRNPGFYTLMYGKVRPGHSPVDQSRPSAILRALTAEAAAQGRLVVDSRQAAAHILATNVGLTLRLIVLGHDDQELSAEIREGVLASITGTSVPESPVARFGHSVIEYAVAHPEILGPAETQLLVEWTRRLSEHADGSDRSPR